MTVASRPIASALPARPLSYFGMSRAPRYSILFALPLLLGYEALAALLAQPGQGELRNGADALLRAAFTTVAGQRGSAVFMAVVILLGVGLVIRDMRKNERLKPIVFAGMLAESTALALAFGFVIGITTAKLLGSLQALAIGNQLADMSWTQRLMLSLGAGLYEELFFRVLLVTGLAAGAKLILGLSARAATITAVIVGAFIFSAFH
jgi:hypothetical protein